MKTTLFAFLIFVFSNLSGQATFHHTTSAANVSGSKTIIDNLFLNDKPNAILFIMPKWNDGGDSYSAIYRLNAAVQYSTTQKRWMICNENQSPMPLGVTFNVLVAPEGNPNYFIQSEPPSPVWNHLQIIDNALTNGKPKALLLVTQNLGTDTALAVYNDNSQLTGYANGKWYIGNNNYFYPTCPPNSVAMPAGAKFNVMVMKNGVVPGFPKRKAKAYMHETSAANTSYFLQHATFLKGRAVSVNSTFIFATPSWGTTQEERPRRYPIAMQYNDSPVAAWFGGTYTQDKWSIVNTNGIPFRRGVLLHVVAIRI